MVSSVSFFRTMIQLGNLIYQGLVIKAKSFISLELHYPSPHQILILIKHILHNNFVLGIMEKAISSWFSSSAEYRSLYLSYIFYLRRRLNNENADTKLKQIQDIRTMLEQAQKFLLESMYYRYKIKLWSGSNYF